MLQNDGMTSNVFLFLDYDRITKLVEDNKELNERLKGKLRNSIET